MAAEFAVRHACREEREELAFAFGKADVASRPSQRFVNLGVLRPLGQNDAVTFCGSCDAVDDLLAWYSLGDETLGTGMDGAAHRRRPIGKAEYHDRPVTGVGAKGAHPFAEGSEFSVGVEQR